tara:strand:+ start:3933 stop:4139 length:207 start_codon:yes stop_codon:yes gene_type:complete
MKNKLKTLITIVAATIAPALITSSSQAWTTYGYQFGDTYIQDSYDWDSGMSFSCYSNTFGNTYITNCY